MYYEYSIQQIENGVLLHLKSWNKQHDLPSKEPVYFATVTEARKYIIRDIQADINGADA